MNDLLLNTTYIFIYGNRSFVEVITRVQGNDLIDMVFATERFLEVAIIQIVGFESTPTDFRSDSPADRTIRA